MVKFKSRESSRIYEEITENGQKSTVRCAVDQNGPTRKTVWYGTLRYGTVRYATVRYGTLRYGTVRFATVRYGTLRYGTVRNKMGFF
jgi:hypothetical protein